MGIKIALAGNPNSGKTTMFNDLTGSAQYVGNWPGVTIEKKEGKLKGVPDAIIQDLPGIYSLSPYTPEEVITRSYLVNEKPDAIINIVDASNIERNLYLTTQLAELGIPMVIALNMIDVTRRNGDVIQLQKLAESLHCQVIETSALKGIGSQEVVKKAIEVATANKPFEPPHVFAGSVEHALAHIEDLISHTEFTQEGASQHHHHADGAMHEGAIVELNLSRWYAIKLFERDEKAAQALQLPANIRKSIEDTIHACEQEMDDDAESIITNQRYAYIQQLISTCVKHGRPKGSLTLSDRIDKIVTNRVLGLPIFALVMFLVYYIAVTTVGSIVTDFTNDTFFGEWIIAPLSEWLPAIGCADWLTSLICDGIMGGVGAVIGFVPQMLVLFFLLAVLEDVGYMARVAFIMDRIFRKFGLSGKSFIPMLIGSGCSVPGIMASRTIENERDRRMTIMTTSFIPCGAKLPIIALVAGSIFQDAWWVGPSAYLIGICAVIVSGIILKKTKVFAGQPAPFVMELPAYHIPSANNVLRSTWERGWSFIKRAGTIILCASILIWFLKSFGVVDGVFQMVEDMDHSILAVVGNTLVPISAPLGFGTWQSTVATVMGLVAKEEVVGVFGVLYGVVGDALELVENADFTGLAAIAQHFTSLSAFSFMLFNLLCAPCFAAMGAIRREMNNGKWTAFAIAYLCIFAYVVSFIFYQLGMLFVSGFTVYTAVALVLLALVIYLLVRKNPYEHTSQNPVVERQVEM